MLANDHSPVENYNQKEHDAYEILAKISAIIKLIQTTENGHLDQTTVYYALETVKKLMSNLEKTAIG